MLEKIKKYANYIIAIGGAVGVLWTAVLWVPKTFMTKADAIELHTELSAEALARDKELQRSIEWNYLETQIGLNVLVINSLQRRLETEDDPEDRIALDIQLKALSNGQAKLLNRRNDITQTRPIWAD